MTGSPNTSERVLDGPHGDLDRQGPTCIATAA